VVEIPIQTAGPLDEDLALANAVAPKAGSRRRHGGGVRPPPAISQPDWDGRGPPPGCCGPPRKGRTARLPRS